MPGLTESSVLSLQLLRKLSAVMQHTVHLDRAFGWTRVALILSAPFRCPPPPPPGVPFCRHTASGSFVHLELEQASLSGGQGLP